MAAPGRTVLAYSEARAALLEALAAAGQLAGAGFTVGAVMLTDTTDDDAAGLAEWGAEKVFVAQGAPQADWDAESAADALAQVAQRVQADAVLIAATDAGREIAGRLAERLGVGCAAWCTEVAVEPGSGALVARCTAWSGRAQVTSRFRRGPAVAAIALGGTRHARPSEGKATVVRVPVQLRQSSVATVTRPGETGPLGALKSARAIVDVGQGFAHREDLEMADDLARVLGAEIACTRPLASERQWLRNWLGLSGERVSADLCVAVGVSGAIQHVIGLRDCKVVVAVNTDEAAPVFDEADYGVLADLYEFLPALASALKTRGVRLASAL